MLSLVYDPNAEASKLAALIHQDQALAAHVIRIANSPAYMPRNPIVSLTACRDDARDEPSLGDIPARQELRADIVVLATGTRPRSSSTAPIDHEHILDSDSILSMIYLPRSLSVIGGGVIACEYASMFSMLGVQVTIIDKASRPLQFLDQEVVMTFQKSYEDHGGRYYGGRMVKEAAWDGVSQVVARLDNGTTVKSEKMLVAVGRQANVEDLNLEAIGFAVNEKGLLTANGYGQTEIPHIYAAGDMLGLRHCPHVPCRGLPGRSARHSRPASEAPDNPCRGVTSRSIWLSLPPLFDPSPSFALRCDPVTGP